MKIDAVQLYYDGGAGFVVYGYRAGC